MTLTPQQALVYVEERRAELTYDHQRAVERLAEIDVELRETEDQARLLRLLIAKKPQQNPEGAR